MMHQPISPFFASFPLSISFLPIYLYANFTSLIGIVFLITAYIFSYISLIALLYIIAIYLQQKMAHVSQPYRMILVSIIYLFLIIAILFTIYLIDPASLSLITNGALPLLIVALISYVILIKLQKKPHLRFKHLIWLSLTVLTGIMIGIITGAFLVIFQSDDPGIIITFTLMFGAIGLIASLLSCATLFTSVKIITSFLPNTMKIF